MTEPANAPVFFLNRDGTASEGTLRLNQPNIPGLVATSPIFKAEMTVPLRVIIWKERNHNPNLLTVHTQSFTEGGNVDGPALSDGFRRDVSKPRGLNEIHEEFNRRIAGLISLE